MAKYCEQSFREFQEQIKNNTKLSNFNSLNQIITKSGELTETQRKIGYSEESEKGKLFTKRTEILNDMKTIATPVKATLDNADLTLKTAIGDDIVGVNHKLCVSTSFYFPVNHI